MTSGGSAVVAESMVAGELLAVALGAIGIAKVSLAKRRNGGVDVAVMLKTQQESMRDLLKETRDHGKILTNILAIIKAERRQR